MLRNFSVAAYISLLVSLISTVAFGQQRGVQLKDKVESTDRPTRRVVVVIGINQYKEWPQLKNAVNDAVGMSKTLQDKLGFVEIVHPLLDGGATRDAIQQLVEDRLRQELKETDDLILFFAGHGTTRVDTVGGKDIETGFLVPVDARGQGPSEHWSDLIEVVPFLESVGRLPARHILVLLDACQSGFALGSAVTTFRGAPRYQQDLMSKISRRVITSARRDQLAADGGPIPGHSLFTGSLIDGINWGKVDLDGNGVITSSEIGLYLQQVVGGGSNSQQTPDFGAFYLDERGEMVIPLKDDTFESVRAHAFNTLQQGQFKSFEELAAKAAAMRPEAPETLYLEYRQALLQGKYDRAGQLVHLLLALDFPEGIIPLSREDLENLKVQLPYWQSVLGLPHEDFPLSLALLSEKTAGHMEPLNIEPIGETFGYRIQPGHKFRWRFTNAGPTPVFLYTIYFDQAGRLLTFSVLEDEGFIFKGIGPGETADGGPMLQDGSIELGEFHFISSPKPKAALLSPLGVMTLGYSEPLHGEGLKGMKQEVVRYTTLYSDSDNH
jgi:hypothetical protein